MSESTSTRDDDEITRRATKRVESKMAFYMHLLVYVCVNAGLILLNTFHGGYRWSFWPLFGWGIGLAIHGIVTFVSLRGEGLQERMVAKEIERLKARR